MFIIKYAGADDEITEQRERRRMDEGLRERSTIENIIIEIMIRL